MHGAVGNAFAVTTAQPVASVMNPLAEAIYLVAWLAIMGLVAGWVICLAIGALDLACALFAALVKRVT